MTKSVRPIDLTVIDKAVRPAHDNLRAAKGIILVSLVGTLFWAILGTVIWRVFFS